MLEQERLVRSRPASRSVRPRERARNGLTQLARAGVACRPRRSARAAARARTRGATRGCRDRSRGCASPSARGRRASDRAASRSRPRGIPCGSSESGRTGPRRPHVASAICIWFRCPKMCDRMNVSTCSAIPAGRCTPGEPCTPTATSSSTAAARIGWKSGWQMCFGSRTVGERERRRGMRHRLARWHVDADHPQPLDAAMHLLHRLVDVGQRDVSDREQPRLPHARQSSAM